MQWPKIRSKNGRGVERFQCFQQILFTDYFFYIKKARHDNFCLVIPDKMVKMKKKGTSCDRRTGTGTPDAFSAH